MPAARRRRPSPGPHRVRPGVPASPHAAPPAGRRCGLLHNPRSRDARRAGHSVLRAVDRRAGADRGDALGCLRGPGRTAERRDERRGPPGRTRGAVMLRFLTAGESHGPELVVVVEGLPAGVEVSVEALDRDLARRLAGYGRGARSTKIELDRAKVVSGLAGGRTTGAPVAIRIVNRDFANQPA